MPLAAGSALACLCAAIAFLTGFILILFVSVGVGCFAVAVGFYFVWVATVRTGGVTYPALALLWVGFGIGAWHYFGWHFHL